jgi:hypothetical protein
MKVSRTLPVLVTCLFIIVSLAAAGCMAGKERQDSPVAATIAQPSPAIPPSADADACTAIGGEICIAGEACPGSWITASDSFSCCSQSCTGTTPQEVLSIEPFGTLQENEDLGPVI